MPLVLGFDPGVTGAIALLRPGRLISIHDIPVITNQKGKKEIQPYELTEIIRSFAKITMAFVEDVHAMPKQGVVSTCSICRSVATIEGVLAGLDIDFTRIPPQTWSKYFFPRVKGKPKKKGKDKDRNRLLAIKLWERKAHMFKRKKDSDRADACLIAKYGLEHLL